MLVAIRDCMADSPAPWPDAWQDEYVDTIRRAATLIQDVAGPSLRMSSLSSGFGSYWQRLTKSQDRSLFEVHCAEIRWYVENFMAAEPLEHEDMHTLRQQYASLCAHATSSLLTQFPFLDPNAVRMAGADHLNRCCRDIEAPLLPIFLRPFTQGEVNAIRDVWHDLRYARVDLWRQLASDDSPEMRQAGSPPVAAELSATHPDYLLTERSLCQLQAQIGAVLARAPEYYRKAVTDHIATQKRRLQSRSRARAEERRLKREYSRQIFQTEQIAFMLAALLETAKCLDNSAVPERQATAAEGGNTRAQ
jgi:hypothetical protein